MCDFGVTICGKSDVVELVRKLGTAKKVHVISIVDPSECQTDIDDVQTLRSEIALDSHHDMFEFYDVRGRKSTQKGAPTMDHIDAIVTKLRTILVQRPEQLIVHCTQGISRSTAVVYMLFRLLKHNQAEAHAVVLRIRPQAFPNQRMLHLFETFYS